ncbi:MAG: alpha/beta hydrolase [Promethearchaeota archaeon]
MKNEYKIGENKVTFLSEGIKLVGNLNIPDNYKEGIKLPAIIFITPATGIKEQVAGVYAKKLADKGFITLAFDHQSYGESEGEPRTTENIYKKSEDIRSAVSFIRSLEQVDKNKIGATGICAGGGYIIQTSVGERRINAVATVSGTLMFKGNVAAAGGEVILKMAGEAKQKYDETGEVTYIPIIAEPNVESNSFVREAYEYYVGNQDRYPTWKNQVDASAFANLAAFDIKSIVSSLTPTPVLFIAGTNAVTGPLSQNAYDNANEPKELFWVDGATHISMYYNEKHINQASEKLDEFFKENLK